MSRVIELAQDLCYFHYILLSHLEKGPGPLFEQTLIFPFQKLSFAKFVKI